MKPFTVCQIDRARPLLVIVATVCASLSFPAWAYILDSVKNLNPIFNQTNLAGWIVCGGEVLPGLEQPAGPAAEVYFKDFEILGRKQR